jgi:hypothetical protein
VDLRDERDDLGEAPLSLLILIPVLGREHLILPLLDNIEQTTQKVDHRVLFICSPGDDARDRCKASGADTMTVTWKPGHGDFARKINKAFRRSKEEWLFQGATDLLFHDRWAELAFKTADATKAGVIGTNDLGNAVVMRGGHSTHTMFSRSYISEFGGGTFDNSGEVFSEKYSHNYVDTDFVQTAMMRRQFAFARNSRVEHLHPHWKKADMDDVYRKGLNDFGADAELYRQRMRGFRLEMAAQGQRRRPGTRGR